MAPIPVYPKKDYNILSTLRMCCVDGEWNNLQRVVALLCPHRVRYIMNYKPETEEEKKWILKLPEPPARHIKFLDQQGSQAIRALCPKGSKGGFRFAGIQMSNAAFEHAMTNLSWLSRQDFSLNTLIDVYDLNRDFLIQACLELELPLPRAISRELFWRYLAELLEHDCYDCIPLASVRSTVHYRDAHNPPVRFARHDDPQRVVAPLAALRQAVRRGTPLPPPRPAPDCTVVLTPRAVCRRTTHPAPHASGLHAPLCAVPALDCALLHALLHWGPRARGGQLRVLSSDLHFIWGVNGVCADGVASGLYAVLHKVCAGYGIRLQAAWIPSAKADAVERLQMRAPAAGAQYQSGLAYDIIGRCMESTDPTANVAGGNLRRWLGYDRHLWD